jgi:hypothetical protein
LGVIVNLRLFLKIGFWGAVGYFALNYLLKPNQSVLEYQKAEKEHGADYRNRIADEDARYKKVMSEFGSLNIVDANLADCIKKNLQMKEYLIRYGNINSATELTEIECYKKGITQLNGIEHFTHLKKLSLQQNEVEYLDPLKNMSSLEELDLSGNPLKSFWEITGLPNLKSLSLSGIRVDDLNEFLRFDSLQALRYYIDDDYACIDLDQFFKDASDKPWRLNRPGNCIAPHGDKTRYF